MKRLYWLTPVILGSVLILPACDQGRDNPATTSESAPPSAMSKISDSDLEKAIRTKLESDNAVKQADLSVRVNVDDNKAILSGTVASQDLKNKAIDLAKSAQPGLIIEDKIDVKPAV